MTMADTVKALIALKAARIVTLTQAEYDALPVKNPQVFYAIVAAS